MPEEKITIIGAGSWGTTLAVVLARNGRPVLLHSVFDDHNRVMAARRENPSFLKGVRFPAALKVMPDLAEALQSRIIVIAVPVQYVRSVLRRAAGVDFVRKGKVFVSVSKGIEVGSLKRVSQIIKEEIPAVSVAVLSGPNIAREVLSGVPSASVIACDKPDVARYLQKLFNLPLFRVYYHQDVVGVELAGALKNIIALACGVSDGLGFGTNTKSALVSRGLVEIARLATALGARTKTFWGISGLGDLTTTCFSPHSRNRSLGEQIGRGKSLSAVIKSMNMVAEGVETVKSAYALSKKLKVEMPITAEIYKVLYKGKSARKAVDALMHRPLKKE